MTNHFNKHDIIENQAKLHFLTFLNAASTIWHKKFLNPSVAELAVSLLDEPI